MQSPFWESFDLNHLNTLNHVKHINTMSASLISKNLARGAVRAGAPRRTAHASASFVQARGKATLPDLPCKLFLSR